MCFATVSVRDGRNRCSGSPESAFTMLSIPTIAVSDSDGKPASVSDRSRSSIPRDRGHLGSERSDAGYGSPLRFLSSRCTVHRSPAEREDRSLAAMI